MASDKDRPTFTVVTPVWNRRSEIERCINSVLVQTLTDFELIVVDDGSTDGTAEAVESIGDDRVRVVRITHAGVSAARNRGADEARGMLLTFLDSDDEVVPTWLERLAAGLQPPSSVVLCGEITVRPDGTRETWHPDPGRLDADSIAPVFLPGRWATTSEAFRAIGGYDTRLQYGENTELALRLLLNPLSTTVAVVDEPLVIRHEREQRDYSMSVKLESALVVLDTYGDYRRRIPSLWGSYQAIAGVELARQRRNWAARRRFFAALGSDRRAEHCKRLIVSLLPGGCRRAWPAETALPGASVLFVVLAPGVGGSVRSIGTALQFTQGVHRTVARVAGSSTAAFLEDRQLAEATVDLPSRAGGDSLPRLKAVAVLTREAWADRRRLAAIHANGLSELILAVIPAVVAGCRIVVWVHEWEVSARVRSLSAAIRLPIPAKRFAAVSAESKRMIVEAGLAERGSVRIVPNPIDPQDVCTSAIEERQGPPVAAYIGTPAHYKGFHLLPELVRGGSSCVQWVVYAGPESSMPQVFAELATLGVDVRGKVFDVAQAYAAADLVVVPSLRESFGRVVAEAMANGIPVVASDLPPLRDLVGNDEAGLLVAAGDIPAMVTAIERLASDPLLRRRLGAEGRQRAAAFRPAPVAEALMEMYGVSSLAGQCRADAPR